MNLPFKLELISMNELQIVYKCLKEKERKKLKKAKIRQRERERGRGTEKRTFSSIK